MLFNFSKCKQMAITKSNRVSKMYPFEFTMSSADGTQRHVIDKSVVEKDLGIYINSTLKFDSQVQESAKKAYSILGILKRTLFRYWKEHTFIKLFTAFVRPHFEYAAPTWSPYKKKDVVLEKVQQRATRLVPSLKNLCYSERLTKLNLTLLETRRTRGDLTIKSC